MEDDSRTHRIIGAALEVHKELSCAANRDEQIVRLGFTDSKKTAILAK